MKIIITLLLLTFFSFNTYSQNSNGCQLLVTHENDVFAINNKDDNYTGGLKIEFQTKKKILKYCPLIQPKNKATVNIRKIGFGGTAYTPQNLDTTGVIIGDRPYASLTYINIGNKAFMPIMNFTINTNLYIGFLGLRGPGNVQSYLHEHHFLGSKRPIPLGWPNQIADKGRFVFNYNLGFEKGFVKPKKWIDPYALLNFNFGSYMINLETGFRLNFLNFNRHLLNNYDPDIPEIYDSLAITDIMELSTSGNKCLRFNLFIESTGRLTLFNSTLTGTFINDHSPYVVDFNDMNKFTLDLKLGANLVIYDLIYLRYTMWGRSQEFYGGKKFHWWGGITIGFSPRRWYN